MHLLRFGILMFSIAMVGLVFVVALTASDEGSIGHLITYPHAKTVDQVLHHKDFDGRLGKGGRSSGRSSARSQVSCES